jgi:cobalt-zinc-cadmium efflux system protein
MGTSETALTAHLVMPAGGGDDAFLAHATEELHEHFEIRHVTLQVTRAPLGNGCAPVDGDLAKGRPDHEEGHGAHAHGHGDGHIHADEHAHAIPIPRPAV